ncbi:hypothetical protein GOP47_0021584 [Adiantum capillus-veneris]|uniref:TIR domain-containing protein n=1 Tax=Adiantum capillus-veneris TaxID=13818 RepID=A0A9D4Z738_ADICA|nr:hypothetical protein GOP47_0021584 [Adiantum capillus-veneris]
MQQSSSCVSDIFLSHSGAQKGFAKDLYRTLTSHGFSTFFDQNRDSLPLGEDFPRHILTAASACKLALVVLSDEYLSSKWPMIELCAVMHATPSVKILPLFFRLVPDDLKRKGNLKKWHSKWRAFAKQDKRISLMEWEKAVQSLRSLHGLAYDATGQEGELTYIERIVNNILSSQGPLAPRKMFETSYVKGRDRLCKVVSLLKDHSLSKTPMFVAMDNISADQSSEELQRILHYVIGLGSQVLLTAGTFDILRPALKRMQHLMCNCICDSMRMPSIDEDEATNLLLETMSLGGDSAPHQLDIGLGQEEEQVVRNILRMCSFGRKDFLPLVVKRMGAMLVSNERDVDRWARDQKRFWSSFNNKVMEAYREDVVQELILKSFKDSLDEELQLLFLDVALFIQPSYFQGSSHEWSILGFMHGRDEAIVRELVRRLKRLCFIEAIDETGRILVHDIYLNFAKSIQEKRFVCRSYYVSRQCSDSHAVEVDLELEERGAEWPVRAMILEVEAVCETICLRNFSSLKSVVIRNCRSLLKVRIAGLTSPVSLDIIGFDGTPLLECNDLDVYASMQNMKSLNLISANTLVVESASALYT